MDIELYDKVLRVKKSIDSTIELIESECSNHPKKTMLELLKSSSRSVIDTLDIIHSNLKTQNN